MARRRTVQVRESIEELQQLRAYYAGTPNAALMQLLLLLREDHSRTIAECAEICKISVRKAERLWKKYREGGMSGLFCVSEGVVEADKIPDPEGSVDSWLSKISPVLNQIGQVCERNGSDQWMLEFRNLLYALVPEADYIVFRCKSFGNDTEGEVPTTVAHRMILPSGQVRVLPAPASNMAEEHEIVRDARVLGIDLSRFHRSPHFVEIHLNPSKQSIQPQAPLAQIGFFRSGERGAFPGYAAERLEHIRPFLASFIRQMAVKDIPSHPQRQVMEIALETLARHSELTKTEKKILALLFSGQDYQAIADAVCNSVSTVRSHIRSIYKKLGVSSKGEAFAYFIGMLNQS